MDRHTIGKNYSIKELEELYLQNWRRYIPGAIYKPLDLEKYLKDKKVDKKPIKNFEDFDPETKKIYYQIKQIILEHNKHQTDIIVWATGSRIYGTWRTKEEEDIIATYNKKKPKYSDYDYCTNAKNIPSKKLFAAKIGVPVDLSDCGSHKKVIVV
jgi:hypothetical protein